MRDRFLDKLFSKSEQQYILLAARPEEMVWLLWSMKEAAYKIYNKVTGIRSFAPLKLRCKINRLNATTCQGEVQVDEILYHTASSIAPGDYVHSIAAGISTSLPKVRTTLLPHACGLDYSAMAPACVSHHGRYLALIF